MSQKRKNIKGQALMEYLVGMLAIFFALFIIKGSVLGNVAQSLDKRLQTSYQYMSKPLP